MEVRGVIRRFVSATDRGEDSVILAQDYQTLLTSAREGAAGHSEANEVDEVMWNAFTTLVSSTRAEALSGPSLESAGLNVEAQKELVRRGFLTVSGARSYRISVPSLGLVAGAVSRGRDEILRVLRRRPNREIAEQQLALKLSRLLGNGSLPLRYHLSSLRGLGWVDVVHAPMDDLVRLTSKGSRRAERTAAPKYELKPKKSVTQVIEEGRQRLGLA
ncbi:hypothetical protein M427DRAFT_61262 [Gonapodya prolifera JEL478]|uniref:Uncharacterized protein n=1 Tax=Gonapodya prolifera (strain JEL478) TaxID=1344416 RepID=A0A139A2T2_GONPJ|nr:hypothetical protein M427DRAFT_61262 [Gonapodya prolifera JEL478]|eukprot:KXS11054.1 hypothetical protein M427DRAFT_61262 [Gonapodya prolifera JEL478]